MVAGPAQAVQGYGDLHVGEHGIPTTPALSLHAQPTFVELLEAVLVFKHGVRLL